MKIYQPNLGLPEKYFYEICISENPLLKIWKNVTFYYINWKWAYRVMFLKKCNDLLHPRRSQWPFFFFFRDFIASPAPRFHRSRDAAMPNFRYTNFFGRVTVGCVTIAPFVTIISWIGTSGVPASRLKLCVPNCSQTSVRQASNGRGHRGVGRRGMQGSPCQLPWVPPEMPPREQ